MKAQLQAATESMSEWLAHPSELGKKPSKIECAGEFDLHDLHYYIFKYKKSMWTSEWLLGVCGGYEGDDLEHCGHVFSDMEPYDPATAEEKAIAMVEHIRAYWMREAEKAESRREGGPFVSFVLLNSKEWNRAKICAALKEQWDITLEADEQEDLSEENLVWDQDGMLASIAYMPAPVPDGEAEHNAASNYMWPEAVEVSKTQQAHLMVAVLPRESSLLEAGELMVKLNCVALAQENAIGCYSTGTVFHPEQYRDTAEMIKDGDFPLLNLLFFGLVRTESGFGAYTYGMETFGKDEMEILDSSASPEELRNFLINIAAYVLLQDVTLNDGETLGSSEEEKIPITRSAGVYLDGETLKIAYKPS